MDDTGRKSQQNEEQVIPNSPISSGSNKEQERISTDFVKPSEPELAISKELEDIGVESVSDLPTITDEDRKAGITPSPQSAQVNTQLSGSVKLPLSQSEARDIVKSNRGVADSIVCLATLILKQVKRKDKNNNGFTNSNITKS